MFFLLLFSPAALSDGCWKFFLAGSDRTGIGLGLFLFVFVERLPAVEPLHVLCAPPLGLRDDEGAVEDGNKGEAAVEVVEAGGAKPVLKVDLKKKNFAEKFNFCIPDFLST